MESSEESAKLIFCIATYESKADEQYNASCSPLQVAKVKKPSDQKNLLLPSHLLMLLFKLTLTLHPILTISIQRTPSILLTQYVNPSMSVLLFFFVLYGHTGPSSGENQ